MSRWANALPNREDQLETKRRAIIREAAKVFSRRGVHGTSLEDVAERLGVSKAALYRYVPSKQDLLYACHKEAMVIADDSLGAAEAEGQTGLEKIRRGMARYMREMIGTMGVPVLILEENALAGAQAAEIMRLRDAFEHRMRRLVEEGIADGSIVKINPKLAVFTLLGAVHWVTKWYSPDGAWSADDVSEALIEVATRGFAANPESELKASLKG
ncbi:MAG: TetR family transcriptional regulator [Methylobacterium sp.]|jgi:TetR/AcrR family transcriptional regulator|nr:TetR family transcriptional regulator [Methylobacterium sp.]MCA3635007.1 TetR family transcriptional regulator [Methylobacterium sp.]MCA3639532.1 TetR family transcriptional regulator [Methylobacterium sp.]MCA3640826.1 TetR family transcriptional regulator [Methylobacterium sp.]MCE2932357.1 TetR/AcrR family transcriptional regulator [Hyphomicrobiales bacterium]